MLFADLKAFRLREDISVYADEAKLTEILTIKARQIIDFSAVYDVVHVTKREGVTGQAFRAGGGHPSVRHRA